MSLDSFKRFVKNKPNLINYVESGKRTWQDFYNLYTLYGDKKEVWDKYLNNTSTNIVTFKDLFDTVKNMDVTSFRDSLTSLQKGIDYLGNLAKEKENVIPKAINPIKRDMYRYFDD